MSPRVDPRLYHPDRAPLFVDRVLARSWICVGLAPPPGTARAFTLLPGSLDEPILVATTPTGELRAWSNVCTHRGALLVTGDVPADGFRCPYHGRRFDGAGRCVAAPGFRHAPDEPLPAVAVRRLGPLVCVNLDPAALPDDPLAALGGRVPFPGDRPLVHDPAGDLTFPIDASALLYVENYLEGLHIPFVHPALNRALDWDAYRTESFDGGVLQVGVATDPAEAFVLPPDHPDAGAPVAAWYLALFPFTLLNVYPWGVSVNLVEPVGAARCRVRYLRLVADPDRIGRGAGSGLDRVEQEDDAIVERVAAGVRSRLYRGGVLEPAREVGVAAFQEWLRDRLADVTGGA